MHCTSGDCVNSRQNRWPFSSDDNKMTIFYNGANNAQELKDVTCKQHLQSGSLEVGILCPMHFTNNANINFHAVHTESSL